MLSYWELLARRNTRSLLGSPGRFSGLHVLRFAGESIIHRVRRPLGEIGEWVSCYRFFRRRGVPTLLPVPPAAAAFDGSAMSGSSPCRCRTPGSDTASPTGRTAGRRPLPAPPAAELRLPHRIPPRSARRPATPLSSS